MKHSKLGYVFALLSLVFVVGCDRHASSKASITLQVPKELQEKVGTQSVAGLNLVHLALQISGPGLTQTYQKIVDAGDGNSIPDTITIDELPAGDNRVIQLLAAYSAPDSDSAHIYYGDVTQSLKNATENVSVPISKLGGAGASTMARVTGRYLTTNLSGPYGTIEMIYRPTGKPAIPVDRKKIIGGWFEVSTFADVPVDFVVSSSDPASNGIVVGTQWTNSSFTPSNQLLKISIPAGYEKRYESNGYTYKSREAEEQIFGYFAANSSFLSDKQICVTPTSQRGNGTLHYSRSLGTTNSSSARVIKYFPTGTTPTVASNQVTMSGGKDRSSCGTLLPENEFHNYLWLYSSSGTQEIAEDFSTAMGMRELTASTSQLNDYYGSYNRNFFESLSYLPLGYPHIKFRVLPGVQFAVSSISVYEIPAYANYMDQKCEEIGNSGSIFKAQISPISVGNTLGIKVADLPLIPSSSYYGFCFNIGGKPVGRMSSLAMYGANGSYYSNNAPVAKIQLNFASGGPGNAVGQCLPLTVNLTTLSNQTPYLTGPVTATITATVASVPTALLYTDATCSTTASNAVTTTFNNETYKYLYFKSPTNDAATVSVTGVTPTLDSTGATTNITPYTKPTTPTAFEIASDLFLGDNVYVSLQVYPLSCLPLRVVAKNTGSLATYDGTVNLSLVDLNDAAYSSSDVRFFDSCLPTATELPSGNLSFSTETSRSVGLRTTTPLTDIKIKIYSPATGSSYVVMNPVPLASGLALVPPTSGLVTGACIPFSVEARNLSGGPQTLARSMTFNMYTNASDVNFYSSGSCSTVYTSFTMAAGTSSKTVYVKVLKSGTYNNFMDSSSSQISVNPINYYDVEGGGLASTGPIAFTAGPLAVSSTPFSGLPTVNGNATFEILGGSAPFTVQNFNTTYVTAANVVKVSDRYYVSVDFATNPGTSSISIVDSNGTPATFSVTVAP